MEFNNISPRGHCICPWQGLQEDPLVSDYILILFTEFGYRSMDYAGKTPWDSRTISGQVNQEAQKVLLQGLIESTWNKDWFAGGFLWKWFHNPNSISQRHDNRFCVHGKKAEQLLSQLYKKYTN